MARPKLPPKLGQVQQILAGLKCCNQFARMGFDWGTLHGCCSSLTRPVWELCDNAHPLTVAYGQQIRPVGVALVNTRLSPVGTTDQRSDWILVIDSADGRTWGTRRADLCQLFVSKVLAQEGFPVRAGCHLEIGNDELPSGASVWYWSVVPDDGHTAMGPFERNGQTEGLPCQSTGETAA